MKNKNYRYPLTEIFRKTTTPMQHPKVKACNLRKKWLIKPCLNMHKEKKTSETYISEVIHDTPYDKRWFFKRTK